MTPDSSPPDNPPSSAPAFDDAESTGPASDASATTWLPPAWRERLAFGGKALVVTSLLAAAGLLVLRAWRHKLEQPAHRVDLSVWTVHQKPDWATAEDVLDVRDESGLAGRALPLYDREMAEIARRALEATPRAKRVISATRVPPDRLDLVLELRRPVAAVALPGGLYVEIDDEGVVLDHPTSARPVRGDLPLRVISGASASVPGAGGTCPDDIRDGLALCRLLDAHRDGLGARTLRTFDEVDVSNHGGRLDPTASEILLRAAASGPDGRRETTCAVEWGRLGTAHGEPPFGEKVAKLETAMRTFGDFAGIARVRVAFAELSVVPESGVDGAWLRNLAEQPQAR